MGLTSDGFIRRSTDVMWESKPKILPEIQQSGYIESAVDRRRTDHHGTDYLGVTWAFENGGKVWEQTLRFLTSFHRSTKCWTISNTTGPVRVMWTCKYTREFSKSHLEMENEGEGRARIQNTHIMPRHPRRIQDRQSIACVIIHLSEIHHSSVIVILAREQGQRKVSRMYVC